MKITFPFKFGTKVFIIGEVDVNWEHCRLCKGQGSYVRNDDWYGGTESVRCRECHGHGRVKPKDGFRGEVLEWQVIKTAIVERYSVTEKHISIVLDNTDWLYGKITYDPDLFFTSRTDAEKACAKRNMKELPTKYTPLIED